MDWPVKYSSVMYRPSPARSTADEPVFRSSTLVTASVVWSWAAISLMTIPFQALTSVGPGSGFSWQAHTARTAGTTRDRILRFLIRLFR